MKIMSEKTGKEYASVEACLAAEKEYDDAIAAKKAAEEKALAERKAKNEAMVAERKTAAAKDEEKRQALIEAQKAYKVIKRINAIFFSLLFIVLFSPLLLLLLLITSVDSHGHPIFKQERYGYLRSTFRIYKFTSMKDEKVTGWGRFMRFTSLDELPQLINLVNGSMSLIGYRPSQKSEDELNTAREGFNLYQIRPGISGWAQINGRDILASHPTLKAKYDGYYLVHFSLLMDIKIFFLSIFKVLKRSDIEEGEIEKKFVEEEKDN